METQQPVIRLHGWNNGNVMWFITTIRSHLGVGLREAVEQLRKLQVEGSLELNPGSIETAKTIGGELLRLGLVQSVDLVMGETVHPLSPPPPPPPIPPPPVCPACQATMKQRMECQACGWLAVPGDRLRWNTAGRCSNCGFAYRYDGRTCSHCGVCRL